MINMPRIQARTGEVQDPPELKGKFVFEVFLSFVGDGREPERILQSKPFDTEVEAKKEMRDAVELLIKESQKAYGAEPTGEYIDLKTNETKIREEN